MNETVTASAPINAGAPATSPAPAGEQIAFDHTALNPTEAAKFASWQMDAGIEATCYVRQSARLIQSDCRADNEAKIGNAA